MSKHKKLKGWDGKKVLEKKGENIEKVGQTLYWDEFAKHDSKNNILQSSPGNYADPSAKILFGVRAELVVTVYQNYAQQEMDKHYPAITWLKNNSARGAVLDIKDKIGHATGYLLGAHYVTGESVGNYLFGLNLNYAMPFYYETADWWHFTMQHVGHYHNTSNKVNNPEIAPYYGEIESSGRWISNGFFGH